MEGKLEKRKEEKERRNEEGKEGMQKGKKERRKEGSAMERRIVITLLKEIR